MTEGHSISGYLDPDERIWKPADDGRVIKILSIAAGLAELDVDGSGSPASAEQLGALGVTDAERQTMASVYSAGKSLWRVSVSHFSAWDCNWPFQPPTDATEPNQPAPKTDAEDEVDDSNCAEGSIIDCENQALGERIPVTGTNLDLNYRSSRVAVDERRRRMTIPVSGSSLPASLKRIEVQVSVAGQRFSHVLQPTANQQLAFEWDGKDVYGRQLQGTARATVKVGYVYDGSYTRPASGQRSFGRPGTQIVGSVARREISMVDTHIPVLGGWDVTGLGFGGWSLSVHHAYDPVGRVLYLGSGERRSSWSAASHTVKTVAGTGTAGAFVEGGQAAQTSLANVESARAMPDGGFLLTATRDGIRKLYRVDAAGRIYTHAQNVGVLRAVTPDGTAYTADGSVCRVYRVSRDGVATTVAGTGVCGFSGDGGSAIEAQIHPYGVAAAPDGALYISDGSYRIRRVSPDGIISTFSGSGVWGVGGDGEVATETPMRFPWGVAVAADGSVLFAEASTNRVRRVSTDGIITTFAGNGVQGCEGDGSLATASPLRSPQDVAVARDGSVVIGDQNLVRRVTPDGVIRTVAGTCQGGFNGDGRAATGTTIGSTGGVSVMPNGDVLVADSNFRVRAIVPSLPGQALGAIHIPSGDGTEVYVFDRDGRHLQTLNSLTGATLQEFRYDSAGLLFEIRDHDGQVTVVERLGTTPVAIVAPGGQRTVLTIFTDLNARLSKGT